MGGREVHRWKRKLISFLTGKKEKGPVAAQLMTLMLLPSVLPWLRCHINASDHASGHCRVELLAAAAVAAAHAHHRQAPESNNLRREHVQQMARVWAPEAGSGGAGSAAGAVQQPASHSSAAWQRQPWRPRQRGAPETAPAAARGKAAPASSAALWCWSPAGSRGGGAWAPPPAPPQPGSATPSCESHSQSNLAAGQRTHASPRWQGFGGLGGAAPVLLLPARRPASMH